MKDISTLLHISPDFYTLWNYRKKILNLQLVNATHEEKLSILLGELNLTESLLKRDIKSYPTWHHRRWIMDMLQDPEAWKKELKQIVIVLKYDLRNFHCWNYRRHILQLLGYKPKDELKFLEGLFEDNPSNYSAWHNRSFMLNKIKEHENIEDLIKEEFDWCKQGFYTDPTDSAAWIYHRWLLSTPEGEKLNLIDEDKELCEELSEMAMEEESIKDRNAQLKWPHLTQVLNAIELRKKKLSKKEYDEILEEFDLLINVDPKRENFYLDKRSDFILQNTIASPQPNKNSEIFDIQLNVQEKLLTRIDALNSISENITIADLSNNQIRQLSLHMKDIPTLHTLLLNQNQIKYIEGIKQFSSLKRLELKNNQIETIGNENVLSETLELLDLRGNKLKDPKFGTIEYLKISFPNLQQILSDS